MKKSRAAQRSEQRDPNAQVGGSIPPPGANNNARRSGKAAALDAHIGRLLRSKPDLVMMIIGPNFVRVEKPVEGTHEFIEPKRLTEK